MDPTSKPNAINIVFNFNHNENPTHDDIAIVKNLFLSNQEVYLADILKGSGLLSDLEVKLLSKGIQAQDPVFKKIHSVANIIIANEFEIIPKDAEPLLQELSQNIAYLKTINNLMPEDHFALYRQRRTGIETLTVEKYVPNRLVSLASSFVYEKNEDPKSVLNHLASKLNKIIENSKEMVTILEEPSARSQQVERGIKSSIEFLGEIMSLKSVLENLKKNPLYVNPQAMMFIEKEIATIEGFEHFLSSVIPKLEENVVMQTMMKSQSPSEISKLKEVYETIHKSRVAFEAEAMSASSLNQENKLIENYTQDLVGLSAIVLNSSSISFKTPLEELSFMPFSINGVQVPTDRERASLVRLVGREAADVILKLVSNEALISLERDLNPNSFERVTTAEITLNSFNQLETTWKMALKSSENITFIKRTIQVPLHDLKSKISENKFKGIQDFRVVDVISPEVPLKVFESMNIDLRDVLTRFNQKPWGIKTGQMLSKNAKPIGIDEKQAFIDILKGKDVSLKPVDITGKEGQTYQIPESFFKDLERWAVLRLNGEMIFSTNLEDLNDLVNAFEKISEIFDEDPNTAIAARVAPIALTQVGLADIAYKLDMVDGFEKTGMAAGGNPKERIQEIKLDGLGNLTLKVKAIKYTLVPEIDPINPTDAFIISRTLTMPLKELKSAIEQKNVSLLVNLQGVDRMSESLYVREKPLLMQPGATNETPRLINSKERAFIIPERDAYELLENFRIEP
jgi:hypothetical protein